MTLAPCILKNKKMIYLFTWNSRYLVREKTLAWKKIYIEKYGDFNLTHYKEIEKVDNNIISQEILSAWFLWEKKLIIIDNIPVSWDNKSKELLEKQGFCLSLLKQIPENNIVLFSSANPDKRSKFYKEFKKQATKIEEFNSSSEQELFSIINRKYSWKIDSGAINLLIKYKAWNLEKIISEIKKLLINNDYIKVSLIKNNIFPELEESIFQVIDDIMNLNISSALDKIKIILSQTSIYAFYNNLLANLRVLVFIQSLKTENINNISQLLDLKNRSFLVNKSYKIDSNKLKKFYISLINLDKKMKTGRMFDNGEEILKYEIEKEILKLWQK